MSEETNTFAENYSELQKINNTLQSEKDNPNIIDDLSGLLKQASQSYDVCMARIAGAEQFLAEFESKKED